MRTAFAVYWVGFVAAFLATAIWETYSPRRKLFTSTERRWGVHSLLWVACVALCALVFRASPLILALNPPFKSWGLFHWFPVTWLLSVPASVILVDLVKYWLHRLFHSVSLGWRVHQVHHSDPDFDVSTTARFHPIEVLVTQAALMGTVLLFGLPVMGVLAAELLANAFSFFEHANASLPDWLEWPLRRCVVTPDMHRTHHSDEIRDQFSNFGEVFSWWDRMFGTYSAEPVRGAASLKTGLAGFQHEGSLQLGFMVTAPFHRVSDSALADDRTRA